MADAFTTLKGQAHLWHPQGTGNCRMSLCAALVVPVQELQATMMSDPMCKRCLKTLGLQQSPKSDGFKP